MLQVDRCPECGVPEIFTQRQAWLNNGDIVQRANPATRMAFLESENMDPLIMNIGDIIGMSIEHMIINISARANEIYLRELIPLEVKKMIKTKQLEVMPFVESITTMAQLFGYGKYELVGFRYANDSGDHATHRVTEPFSVYMAAGAYAGAVSAVVGEEIAVFYKLISPGVYEFSTRYTEYPAELKEKLRMVNYHQKEGDLELERCTTCEGLKALHRFRWDLERGQIINELTGRRMIILGPVMLDPIFTALQAELDMDIPSVVIEAQRRFVRTGFYPLDLLHSEENLRTQLALRGVGNLREMKMDRKGVHLRLGNPCLYLLVIGLLQGLFEMTYDVTSNLDWELSEHGDLLLEIKAKKS
jgi:hypothetical protein